MHDGNASSFLCINYLQLQLTIARPGVKVIVNMPRAYSQDLRWRAIWLTEILGFKINEVSLLLHMSKKTISRM